MPAKPRAGAGQAQKTDTAGDEKLCPICGKPAREAVRPFCSSRCRDVDLNRWLSNSYIVPGRDGDEDAD